MKKLFVYFLKILGKIIIKNDKNYIHVKIGDIVVVKNNSREYNKFALKECYKIIFGIPFYKWKKYENFWKSYTSGQFCLQSVCYYDGGLSTYTHYFKTPEEALQFDKDYKPMTTEYYKGFRIDCVMNCYSNPKKNKDGTPNHEYRHECFGSEFHKSIESLKKSIDQWKERYHTKWIK